MIVIQEIRAFSGRYCDVGVRSLIHVISLSPKMRVRGQGVFFSERYYCISGQLSRLP